MTFGTRIQYGLLVGLCKFAGWLPNRFLYGPLKQLIYFILCKVAKYRVDVVRENLRNSFPMKSGEELALIEHDFYMHLAEVMVDTIKLATISRREIMERMTYLGIEAMDKTELAGRSWIAAMSHFGSWELTVNFALYTDHGVLAVYRPLKNEVMDRFYRHVRSRFGTKPTAMNDVLKETIKAHRPGAKPVAVALIADQTPPIHELKTWYPFLRQYTSFFSGTEKMALKFGMPVYFAYIRKTSPQHYQMEFIPIYDGKEQIAEHEITRRYIANLEAMIEETPCLWMWSHRRWKYKKPADA